MATITTEMEGREMRPFAYTGPASYATGGDAVTAADFKLSRLDYLIFTSAGEGGAVFGWDPSASKIMAFWVDTTVDGAVMAEITASTNLSSNIVHGIAVGLP